MIEVFPSPTPNSILWNVLFLSPILFQVIIYADQFVDCRYYDHSWPLVAYDLHLHYDYASNKLFVPAAILQLPYYDQHSPIAIQFGSLGFHLASHMLKAFDLIGLYYNLPDGRLSNNRKFIEDVDLNRGLRCLSRQINSISNHQVII